MPISMLERGMLYPLQTLYYARDAHVWRREILFSIRGAGPGWLGFLRVLSAVGHGGLSAQGVA
jgi:hypothetical protein